MIDSAKARIILLSNRLIQIEEERASLDTEYASKKAELHSLCNLSAPINSLPEEILVEIFLLGSRAQTRSWPWRNHVRLELNVSHVQRSWRRVALRCPALWVWIYRSPYQHNMDPILAYLERSQQMPIHVVLETGVGTKEDIMEELNCKAKAAEKVHEDIKPFLRLIESQISRCARLQINSWNEEEEPAIIQMLAHLSAPLLRSLIIDNQRHTPPEYPPLPPGGRILVHETPLLSNLELKLDRNIYTPHVGSVTTLQLRLSRNALISTYETLTQALLEMPLLTNVRVYDAERWPSTLKLCLPTVRTLCIDIEHDTAVVQFLNILQAPLLQKVGISVTGHRMDYDGTPIPTPLPRFPQVSELTLKNSEAVSRKDHSNKIQTTESLERQLVRVFPDIITLKDYSYCLSSALRLVLGDQDPSSSSPCSIPLWRHLQVVGLWKCDIVELVSVRSLFIYRADMGHPIRELLLPYWLVSSIRHRNIREELPIAISELTPDLLVAGLRFDHTF